MNRGASVLKNDSFNRFHIHTYTCAYLKKKKKEILENKKNNFHLVKVYFKKAAVYYLKQIRAENGG